MSNINISVSGSGSINLLNTGDISVFKKKLTRLITWGNLDSSSVVYDEYEGFLDIQHNLRAFAVLKADRTVEAWGSSGYGGDFTNNLYTGQGDMTSLLVDVDRIIPSLRRAFSALTNSGNVYSWGSTGSGGKSTYPRGASITSGNTTDVVGYYNGFIAINTSGAVTSWGDADMDFTTASKYNTTQYPGGIAAELSSGVTAIVKPLDLKYENIPTTSQLVFKGDSILSWGSQTTGGDSSDGACTGGSVSSGCVSAVNTYKAWSALKSDGSVVSWGDAEYGGTQVKNGSSIAASLTSGVVSLTAGYGSFVALKDDNTAVVWGSNGGDNTGVTLTNIASVVTFRTSFGVIKLDGTAEVWGDNGLVTGLIGGTLTNVTKIAGSSAAYAALKSDGSVVVWGDASLGGDFTDNAYTGQGDLSSVLSSGVTDIIGGLYSITALKSDGTVFSWGNQTLGGDSSAEDLTGITSIYNAASSYAAIGLN